MFRGVLWFRPDVVEVLWVITVPLGFCLKLFSDFWKQDAVGAYGGGANGVVDDSAFDVFRVVGFRI